MILIKNMLKKMMLFKNIYSKFFRFVKKMLIVSFGGFWLFSFVYPYTLGYINDIASYIADFLMYYIIYIYNKQDIYNMQDISSKQNNLKIFIYEAIRLAMSMIFVSNIFKLVQYIENLFKVKKRNSKYLYRIYLEKIPFKTKDNRSKHKLIDDWSKKNEEIVLLMDKLENEKDQSKISDLNNQLLHDLKILIKIIEEYNEPKSK